MDVPAIGSIKGRGSHLKKVHTYVGGPPTKSILKKAVDNENREASNGDPSFPVVQQYVSNTWPKFGFEKIIRNDDGVYLFKFSSKSGMDQVLEKGLWLIHEVTKVLVWVKLYNVSVLAYSEDGLSLIATKIVEIPKPLDKNAKANTMEDNDDGFVEVKSRKKKKGAELRSFGGLRLNKPNSKVIWQQKKGGEAKG
nr:hypothetical protein [Tanacetum cinerariifolium]